MKRETERRKPKGANDHLALALATWGVGYIPGAPGTYGSAVGVAIFLLLQYCFLGFAVGEQVLTVNIVFAGFLIFLVVLTLAGIWASNRSTELLGNEDPSEVVVDEVIGQLIVFLFVPFGIGWPLIITGFLLFRLFDIWKPYPINELQALKGGLGICADDIAAGIYAGIALSVIYAATLFFS